MTPTTGEDRLPGQGWSTLPERRAGVPAVEDRPDLLDPDGPWLAGRVDGDVVDVYQTAAQGGLVALTREVTRRVELVLRSAGIDPAAVACHVLPCGPDLRVVFRGPPIDRSTRSALAVRALDAVHSASCRTIGQVDIDYVERAA